MTLSIKHTFQSLKVDGADTTLVRPSNWNADHTIVAQAKSIMANAAASSGAVSDVLLGDGMWFNGANKLDVRLVGMLGAFAMATAPTGWLKANGATISRTTYADLFAAIGVTWGAGDGSTTFSIPDLRGCFVRGYDDGRGFDSGRVFGVLQTSDLGTHTHSVTDPGHNHGISDPGHAHGVGDPGHAHTIFGTTGTSGASYARVDGTSNNVNTNTQPSGTGVFIGAAGTGIGILGHSSNISIAAAGGTETRPTNHTGLICIKY